MQFLEEKIDPLIKGLCLHHTERTTKVAGPARSGLLRHRGEHAEDALFVSQYLIFVLITALLTGRGQKNN